MGARGRAMSKIYPVKDPKNNSRRRDQPLTQPILYLDHPHPLPLPSPSIYSHGSHEPDGASIRSHGNHEPDGPSILTVWKRSSMSFQGTDGFTVFDRHGSLVFRVDNYTRKSWSSLLLMDGSGRPLLTLKPQLFSMLHQWTAFRGEDHHSTKAFTMRRPSNNMNMIIPRNVKACEAQVFIEETRSTTPDLIAEGSFRMRHCRITTSVDGLLVATISRKRISSTLLLNDDVFTLTVQPGFQPDIVMAIVIILDRICYKSFAPILCS